MKRVAVIIAASVLVLFAAIYFLKNQSASEDSQPTEDALSLHDKNRTRQFWEIYRQAGSQRLAGKLEAAYESYASALELNPDHENAMYYFGSIAFALDKFTEAEKAWKRLLKVNPSNTRAHYQLGDLYLNFELEEFFDIEKAEAEYRSALKINKEESRPHLRLGHVALFNGNLPLAGQYFDAVIGSNFKSVEAYFLRGYVAWEQGDTDKALSMFANARKHSNSVQPIRGVHGEGDTKPGGLFERLESSRHRSTFYPYFAGISKLDESKISHRVMDKKYRQLNAFLNKIRRISHS